MMATHFKGTFWICSDGFHPALRTSLMHTWGFIPATSADDADLLVVLDAGELNRNIKVNESEHLYLVLTVDYEVDDFRAYYGQDGNVLITCEQSKLADLRQFLAKHKGWCRRRHHRLAQSQS